VGGEPRLLQLEILYKKRKKCTLNLHNTTIIILYKEINMEINLHNVTAISLGPIKKLESNGTDFYVRSFFIGNKNDNSEITLFSDDRQKLAILLQEVL
jgi:hypothetical protein